MSTMTGMQGAVAAITLIATTTHAHRGASPLSETTIALLTRDVVRISHVACDLVSTSVHQIRRVVAPRPLGRWSVLSVVVLEVTWNW